MRRSVSAPATGGSRTFSSSRSGGDRFWRPIGAVVTAILALLVLVPSGSMVHRIGSDPLPLPSRDPIASVSGVSGVPVELVEVGNQTVGNLSSFWGINFRPTEPAGPLATVETEGTPLTYYRWPGGTIADSLNMSSGLDYGNNSSRPEHTNESEFVGWCRTVACHAIFQVPGEINSTSTAAWEVYYTIKTLGFYPDYWEIGDEPEGWTHFNTPWAEWNSSQNNITTAATYAVLEQQYILAMQAEASRLGTTLKFIGLPGEGNGISNEGRWINDTVQVNGPNISAVAIHVYPAGAGSSGPFTLSRFFQSLESTSSISARASNDERWIKKACPTCSPIQLFVDELGSGTGNNGGWTPFMKSYSEVPYITAELIQAMNDSVSNVDVFALNSSYPGSLFNGTGVARPVDSLYTQILPHFQPNLLEYNVTDRVSEAYLAASESPNGSSITLLAANANATSPVQFNVSGPGFPVTSTYTTWSWNNSTPEVQSSTAAGPDRDWTLPPQGTLLVSVCVSSPCSSGRSDRFPVGFNETGLPSGTNWSVTFNGSTLSSASSSIAFTAANGTYPYSIAAAPGYVPARSSGVVAVQGAAQVVPVNFSALTYNVSFTESGLPGSTSWSVSLNGTPASSTRSSIVFAEPNGTYSYSIADLSGWHQENISYHGTITVSGASVSELVTFHRMTYPVTFSETGLPTGTNWSVVLNGLTNFSTTSIVGFREPNGTFRFTVPALPGFIPVTATGSLTVNGNGVAMPIDWLSPSEYPITFTETGLPAGTNWSVYLNGQSQNRSESRIVFNVPNGTYTFTIVVTPSGYSVSSSASGNSVTVNGAAVNIAVTMTAVKGSNSTTTNPDFLGTLAFGLISGVAAIAVVLLVLAVYFARRKPPIPPVQPVKGGPGALR